MSIEVDFSQDPADCSSVTVSYKDNNVGVANGYCTDSAPLEI